jgi:hypothetical protein
MTERPKETHCPELIVSVESRKGGVGKTTAALCLGRILRDRGYSVLVLDVDVTGTDAADIANSPFWSSDLHIIQQLSSDGDMQKEKTPANLLALFDECFMAGRTVPAFSAAPLDGVGLQVDLELVNVLGSQVYRTERQQQTKAGARSRKITCLERPSVLFDDLHTLWLLEFIQDIVSDFCHVAREANPGAGKVAVILDNSPGYVGIAPAIHEWLTDCGPEIGKFLTVASLDNQDLRACGRAIDVLHGLYRTKWETSRLFLRAKKPGRDISLAKEQQAFFMRLATARSEHGISAKELAFFKAEPHSSTKRKTDPADGDVFLNSPNKYIGLLINRVPRAVKRGHLAYELSSPSTDGLSSVMEVSPHAEGVARWREHMVSYDEYIENQFLLQSLQRRGRRPERRLRPLLESIDRAIERVGIKTHGAEGSMALFGADGSNSGHLRSQLIICNKFVTEARSALDDAGLGHLARLVHDEWLPGSIIPSFRSALSSLLRASEFPYFETVPFEMDSGPVNPGAQDFVRDLKKHILMEMQESSGGAGGQDESVVDILSGVMTSLVALSLTSPLWHSPLREELVGLFAGVLSIELRHWKRGRDGRSPRQGVQRFLAQESVKHSELEKEFMMSRQLRFFEHHMMRPDGVSAFSDFYSACTSSQARLIDSAADSRFLLQIMQFMVREELEKGQLFPSVRRLAEDVIVRKTVRHEEIPSRMASALQSAEYFMEFSQVLNRLLRDWGRADG